QAGIIKIHLEQSMTQVAEFPFDSESKFLAKAFVISKKEDVLFVSGAPERLLKMSKMSAKMEEEARIELENLTVRGLRVIAVASKKIDNLKDLVNNLDFVGLIALKDPVRKEVKGAIRTCRKAGMKVIIATGDHKLTAIAVAREIGLEFSEENIMEGKDLDNLSDAEFFQIADRIQIYARLEPKHKMRIISAWQEKGEVIAMTGDGINDAPALKKADIGVALGSGTEVAKEASDLILLSDSFNVIVSAVKEGRAVLDNIRKVITYLLTDSFAETILVGGAVLFGFPLPITAAQILWVNLIEDGLPDIALGFEPKEKDLMSQSPKSRKSPLLNSEMKFLIFVIGILTNIFLLLLFWALLRYSNYEMEHIRTIVFSALALNSLFYVFSCKSLRQNLWRINIFSNKFLIYAWIFGITGLVAAIYVPFLQVLLKTVPLNLIDWIIISVLSIIELVLIEITKYIFIMRNRA
ncbi:MAG: HAD-IC family P-type ATPase, partial [bacterium]|nr:HAD-IC family P-type ATPase [bacterium]